jgi:hypothetical protein
MPEDLTNLTGNIHKDPVDRETLKLEITEIRNEVTPINLLRRSILKK